MKYQDFAKKLSAFGLFFCVGSSADNRNKKWDMLLVALFVTLSQRQTHLTNFIPVFCASKITHRSVITISVSGYHTTIKYYAFGAAEPKLSVRYFQVHFECLQPIKSMQHRGISVKLKPCPNGSHFINLSDWKLIQWNVHYLILISVDIFGTLGIRFIRSARSQAT